MSFGAFSQHHYAISGLTILLVGFGEGLSEVDKYPRNCAYLHEGTIYEQVSHLLRKHCPTEENQDQKRYDDCRNVDRCIGEL